jgi:16S rRNA (uracil1498-N3)-methyltransferase
MTLSDDASHYVARVHRRHVGDALLLFDPEAGLEANAVVAAVTGKRVVCEVADLRSGERGGVKGLRLVQGLGKGDKPDQVVRDGVVLGAQSIDFVVCERSVVQATSRDAAKQERLSRVAIEAARQCGRSNLPRIRLGLTWEQALGQHCDAFSVVLQPGEDIPLVEVVLGTRPPTRDTALWIGPEGGFSDAEVRALVTSGAHLASLGDLVLRTELAAVVGLARVGACLALPPTPR